MPSLVDPLNILTCCLRKASAMKHVHTSMSLRILALRKTQNLTLKSLGLKVGVSVSQVWLWESGGPVPDARLDQLAAALNTTATYLKTGKHPRPPKSQARLQNTQSSTALARAQRVNETELSQIITASRAIIAERAGLDIACVQVVFQNG